MRRNAFTVIELLVVLGSIAVLMGIVFPVVGKVRQAARVADTKNTIAVLSAACEEFYTQTQQYPGRFGHMSIYAPNTSLAPDLYTPTLAPWPVPERQQITGTENLVLELRGGLKTISGKLVYDPAEVDKGGKLYASGLKLSPKDTTGPFSYQDATPANDSRIPEFVDNFPDAMPILYLKCRVGARVTPPLTNSNNPVITDNGGGPPPLRTGPYDLSQIIGYTGSKIGAPPAAGHGLRSVNTTATLTGTAPFDAYPYFLNPNIPDTPRQKDTFILIAAGPDRIYGTADDITNFGSVLP